MNSLLDGRKRGRHILPKALGAARSDCAMFETKAKLKDTELILL